MRFQGSFVATARVLALCVCVLGFTSSAFAVKQEATRVTRVVPMARVEVVGASVDGNFLTLRVMVGGCDNTKDFTVKSLKAGKRATLWLEKPAKDCMLAVMPSQGQYKVDLREAFPKTKSLSLTIESSRGVEVFKVGWAQK